MIDIRNYINTIDQYYFEKFINCKDNGEKLEVILYGAGKKGEMFLKDYENIEVRYFCDDDIEKIGKNINGIKVISIDDLNGSNLDIPIIITSKWSDDISHKLRKYGHKHIYHRFSLEYLMHLEELQKVYELLDDEKSREAFLGIVHYVFKQDPKVFKKITFDEQQYFLKDIFKFTDNESIIDGGAFVGDTLLNYRRVINKNFRDYYCFEPDCENLKRLKNTVDKLKLNNVDIFPYGLYSDKKEIAFCYAHNSSACIDSFSKDFINVVDIDTILGDKNITMIKMDIEGAEYDALLGAKQCIVTQRPKLAICIYHLSYDLWKIPLLIKSMVPEYKIFIRHHNEKCWYETVLYAVI